MNRRGETAWRAIAWMALLLSMVGPTYLAAGETDWPCWRGWRRDGVVKGFQAPESWPEQLTRKWSQPVGIGHASPVIVDGRVYQFARRDEREVAACHDLDGKLIWEAGYEAPYKMHSAAQSHGKGPKATPAVDDGRLFTLGIDGVLTCWDTNRGKQLWQLDQRDRFAKPSPLYGAACSPLVRSGHVFVHLGGHDSGALVAVDARSGKIRWSWDDDGPAYASPIVGMPAGTKQLITQTQDRCLALSGAGKLLWSVPFGTQYDQNSVTPLMIGDDLLVVSGTGRGTTGYAIRRNGDTLQAAEKWHNRKVSMYMSSPVLAAGRLFLFREQNRGQLVCLDAGGAIKWQGPGRQGDNASLLSLGSIVAMLNTEGRLVFVDAKADDYRELAQYQVSETPSWAHLVITGADIWIKDRETLTRWSLR